MIDIRARSTIGCGTTVPIGEPLAARHLKNVVVKTDERKFVVRWIGAGFVRVMVDVFFTQQIRLIRILI